MTTNRLASLFAIFATAFSVVLASAFVPAPFGKGKATATPRTVSFSTKAARTPTRTATAPATNTASATATETPTDTPTGTDGPTPTLSQTPAPPLALYTPYPSAPLCAEHDNVTFHTLWNSAAGCHYDHEHGSTPFTQAVSDTFPGYDLSALIGGVGVGHTNPSSPMENTHKHGGFKWQVTIPAPQGCVIGFEGATAGVDAAVIQYHNFGDYAIEFEARIHSALLLARMCLPGQDPGYIYTVQHQDYGQRVSQYQGDCLNYPDLACSYDSRLGPYMTIDRYGDCVGCRPSLEFVLSRNVNANSIWTSKGGHTAPSGSTLFNLLFRVRDNYQLLEWQDNTYPYIFGWVCGGVAYNPNGCRYNNSTSTVHEVAGIVPEAWDNLAGFDTDPEVGRVTGEGYTSRFGELNLNCTAPDDNCFPVKLVRAFTGEYGGELSANKVTNPDPANTPERDIYFCGVLVCNETSPGAVPSGWLGSEN